MNAVPLTKMIQHQFAPAEDPAPHPWATTLFPPALKLVLVQGLHSAVATHYCVMRLKNTKLFFFYGL